MLPDFDPEFASPADYAKLYRELGMQVVPAFMPHEAKAWKRPYLQEWKQYTNEIVSQETFDGWYGETGQYSARSNMGLITGVGPRRVVVVDLDTHKNGKAQIWWDGIHAEYNAGIMSECPTQRTGGGGYQMFFFAPAGWTCPTGTNSELGVDVRGAGGFAMLPPSRHESGKHYDWIEDQEPWTIEICDMPDWMCQEIELLFPGTSGQYSAGSRTHTPTPDHKTDEWGKIVDGREDRMFRMIFRKIVDLYRECPFIDKESESKAIIECFNDYVDEVETRIKEFGTPKHLLLEREGRGKTLFDQKWRSTMRQWDTKIHDEAQKPFTPRQSNNLSNNEINSWTSSIHKDTEEAPSSESSDEEKPPEGLFKVYRKSDLKNLPPPEFIIEDLIQRYGSNYITGWPGCGKSFYLIGSCIAIATGQEKFLGKKVNVHGPIVYVTTEGIHDHYTRMRAYEEHYGVSVDEERYLVIPEAMNLLQSGDRLKLLQTIDWNIKRMQEPPVYVIFDTVSRVIPGVDENDQKEMSLFVKAEGEVLYHFKTTTGLAHHLSRSGNGNMRGSTVLEGAADTITVLKREPGEEKGTIYAAKRKSAADGWELEFMLKNVEVEPFRSSLVITDANQSAQKADFGGRQETGYIFAAAVKMTLAERDEILMAANDAWNLKEPWSLAPQNKFTPRYAPRGIGKVLKKRIKNDSHALLVASAFVDMGFWSVEVRDSDKKIRGLKVSNMYQNGTDNTRKSYGSHNADFRENLEQDQ